MIATRTALSRAIVAAALLFACASSASAQLVRLAGPNEAFRGGFAKLDVAYDSVNNVYLVVWGTMAANPVMGVFVDRQGNDVGGVFAISDFATEGPAGFPRVVFGGPPDNPTFLVTYTVLNNSTFPKRVRLLKFNAGPQLGPTLDVANVGGAWPDSDISTPVWTGSHFVVTWRMANYPYDDTYLRGIDALGNYTTGIGKISDGLDAEANPSVACDPITGRCLAVGFAWGVPFGTDAPGGTWSRFFDAQALTTIGPVTYLDCPAGRPGCSETLNAAYIREDQRVVFNTATRLFQAVWVYSRNYIDGRQVSPDGTKGPLEQIAGPHLGQLGLSYNSGNASTIVTYKDWTYALASEIDGAGHLVNPTQPLIISALPDDIGSNEFYPVPAADPGDGQWLVGYESYYRSGRVDIVGKLGTQIPQSPTVTSVSPAIGRVAGGTAVTITGTLFQAGATVSFGGAAAANVTVVSSTQITATTPSHVAGTVTVSVTIPGGQTASLASAFNYVPPLATDLNGDGQPELVWRNSATGETILWSMSGTTYSNWSQLNVPLDVNWNIVAIGDFNGDGKPDLLLRNRVTGDNRMALNDGNGGVTVSATQAQPDINWKVAGAGDFNGDGNADIVWRNILTGENIVWYMNGVNVVGSATMPAAGDMNWRICAVGDFNGDGRPDLVWHNLATGENQIWFMNNVAFVGSVALETTVGLGWRLVGAVDLSGDGKPDLVWRNVMTGENCVWVMNGAVHVSTTALPSVQGSDWQLMEPPDALPAGASDINCDGNNDIVWRNTVTGENTVWLMSKTSFVTSAFMPTVTDLNWRIAATADFDGDGKPDVLWRNIVTGRNIVWFMNGTTYVAWAELPSVPAVDWQIVGVGDFNGDGKPDIVWRNGTNGQALVWYMNGTTYVDFAWLPYVADTTWKVVAVVDFNGDRSPDLVWQNAVTNQLIVWYLNGPTYVDYASLTSVADVNWRVVAVRDFDGDGKPDLLWRNQSTGENQIWRLSGTTFLASVYLPTEASPAWRIVGLP